MISESAAELSTAVVAALSAPRVSLPRRRVIAAVVLLELCTWREAQEALEAAVQHYRANGWGCQWNTLPPWISETVIQLHARRHRQRLGNAGNVIALFPDGAS